ncbi:YesK family protein [Bacillus gobiensis]|uniref:YesK family protein n=1 Tax=Bacillus gobiensis TaxID=1441095 RepID=UPI003D1BDD36
MFFLLPLAYGSIFGALILIVSLLFKKFHKPSISKATTYVGMVVGVGTIIYSIQVIRGFEGAFIGLVGLTIIIESIIILLFLSHSIKKQNLTT